MKLDCGIVQDLYPQYVKGDLSSELNKRIDEHLASCEACQSVYEKEEGFYDLVGQDNEIIQPDRSLDEKLKQSLKKQQYYRNMKTILVILVTIVAIYFFFFRFTFFIGSTDLTSPSFEDDFQRIQERLDMSKDAAVTEMRLIFNSAGQMEQFQTRIVDFSATYLDIYDMTLSHRMEGFHTYRVKHSRINDPYFISASRAQLPAQKLFHILDQVDYGSILEEIESTRYVLATTGERTEMSGHFLNTRDGQFLMINSDGVEELEEGNMYSDVFHLLLDSNTDVRSYIFK